jgi:hypothetical protein
MDHYSHFKLLSLSLQEEETEYGMYMEI